MLAQIINIAGLAPICHTEDQSMNLFYFIPGYTESIFNAGREPALVMLLAFLVTFVLARSYTRMARIRGWGSTVIGGIHIHHLVFGLVVAFLAGALEFALLPPEGPVKLLLAAMFGSGAALVLDEFALAFHLKDVYWEREGRKSVDAVVIGSILGLMFLLQVAPFGGPNDMPRLVLTIGQVINLGFVLVTAFKGKLFFAILGIFIPVVAIVGAVRLANPESGYAHRFYGKNSSKMKRAVKRHEDYLRRWGHRKEWLWDIMGGKIGRHNT